MKTILVIGLGRFGRFMARKLEEQKNEVLAIDINEKRVTDSLPYIKNARIGDATNEQFMSSLGIRNFDLCVVAIGDNFQSSLEATSLLKDLGAKFVLSRANRDVHKKFLLRNGADEVIYSERETAERLAVKYGSDNIFDYIELTPDYSIYEIAVPKSWVGKSIIEKAVRVKYRISILSTKINGEIQSLPSPDHVFTEDETLIIMGHNDDVKPLTK